MSLREKLIDVWDLGPFDPGLIASIELEAEMIRQYLEAEHEIFRSYHNATGSARPLVQPDNPYESSFYELEQQIALEMKKRTIRAFHYTRMTDEEVVILKRQGIYLSTPETLRRRLDAVVAGGSLTLDTANTLYEKSPLNGGQLESRSNKFWMTSHPVAVDDLGVRPLLK